jgi:hypothetical protein
MAGIYSVRINNSIPVTKASRSLSSGSHLDIIQDEVNRNNSQLNEDDGIKAFGYDVVLKRVSQIIKAVTDRKPTKILHINPENNLMAYLGEKATGFEIVGCSNKTTNSSVEDVSFEGKEKYSSIEYLTFDNEKQLPFRNKTFQFVINCTPVHCTLQNSFSQMVWPTEVIRLITTGGYGIIGFDNTMWEALNMMEQLSALDENASPLELLALQEVPYSTVTASRFVDTTIKTNSDSNSDVSVPEEEEQMDSTYWLALIRRKEM